jgi:hypothetical protein
MKKNISITGLTLLLLLTLASCNREPSAPPEPVVDYVTIAQLKDMHTAGTKDTIKTNIYIQGVITLTPELGNVPDFVAYIQDSTDAICITVSDATNTLAMNSEVKILCNGVAFTEYNGLLQFGELSIDSQVEVISLTATLPDPDTVTVAQLLTGDYQSRYVYLPGVQFESAGTFSGSQYVSDCSSDIAVYTRSAASFSGNTLPTGNGSVKGVSSIYYSQQILLRDPSELDMTGTRCGEPSVVYLSQDFETLTTNYTNVSTLSGWLTYSEAGTKTWFSYVHSGNHFVETSATGTTATSSIAWMTAPIIDLTSAIKPYISFNTADGKDTGATLQLYASTDYDGSASPWNFTWNELTFTHPASSPTEFSSFVSSGQVDLSAYKGGSVYIAWVYTGSPTLTTYWEVDNVVVAEK